MRVAIVHDDLVQWGGAERILEGICEIYPDAPIFTSVFDFSNKELFRRFSNKKIITSFIQKIPGWKSMYKPLLPLYPIAFEQFDFSQFNLVISHTTRFAKSVITKPETTHISYCHTPPRFLWHFPSDNYPVFADLPLSYLRVFDQMAGKRVDFFIAGSKNARVKIKKIYHVDAPVVYPYVDLERFKNIEIFDGGYFVAISRLNSYKKIDLIIKTCKSLGRALKVIGSGTIENIESSSIEFLGNLSDELTIKVLSGAKALIIAAAEDFGLTALEAQALGKPVLAYRKGGSLETVKEGETGLFFDHQDVESITEAIDKLDRIKINPEKCRENAGRFSKETFIKEFKQVIANLS